MKHCFSLLTVLLLFCLPVFSFESGTAYTIQLVSNGGYLYLDNSANTGSSTSAASYTTTVQSTFYITGSGSSYKIQCVESGLYMGRYVKSSGSYNTSGNIASMSSSSSDADWTITQSSENVYIIKRGSNSRYALGLASTDDGKIYSDGNSNTTWKIVPVPSAGEPTQLVINEVMSANLGEALDPSYNFGAWVELYNPTDEAASLNGVVVTDGDGNSFTLDSYHGTVPAKGYKNLWFGHYAIDTTTHYDSSYKTYRGQVNLDLDCDGGSISISYNGETLDNVEYPEAISRCSWARTTDGGDEWNYCGWPTSESTNAGALFSDTQLDAPAPTVRGGRFTGSQSFSVDIPSGSSLCYTTDGSVPTKDNGTIISAESSPASFTVSATTCYRFRFIANDQLPSKVVTCSFIKDAPQGANILSVVTNDKYLYDNTLGIYVQGTNCGKSLGGWSYWEYGNYFQDWERPASVQLYKSGSSDSLFIDQEANMAMSGAKSRTNTRKSFKLKTGKEFNGLNFYQQQGVFDRKPYNRYKDFMARAGGDTDYYINLDNTLQKILIASGVYVDAQDYRPVEVYLNGVDKGLFYVRETTNKQFGASNYGMDTDAMDTFEENDIDNLSITTGNWDAFEELYSTAKTASTSDASWQRIHELLDVDEYINYFATETYLNNGDWPQNNFKMFRDYADGRFHVVVQDLDWASYSSTSPFTHIDNQSSSYPYAEVGSQENRLVTIFLNLMKRKEFCRQFVDAFCLMAGSVYDPEFVSQQITALKAELAPYYINNTSTLNTTMSSIESLVSSSVQSTRISQIKSWGTAGLSSSTQITAQLSANIKDAAILLNGLPVPRTQFSGSLFLPVTVKAQGTRGYKFSGWSKDGTIVSTEESLTLTEGGTYQAKYEATTESVLPPVVINEVGAANDVYLNDRLKKTDYIELYNTTDKDINLKGVYISNDILAPQKCSLSKATIPAHGYKIVWADEKKSVTELHSTFKLGNDSNSVVILTAADGSWADTLYYHPQTYRQSVGRYPDGGENIYRFDIPTIGRSNYTTSYSKQLEFNPKTYVTRAVKAGTYESFCLPFDVNVKDIRSNFDKIYCMTGDYFEIIPAFGETLPAKAAKAKTATATESEEEESGEESADITSYNSCQAPFVLWQNSDDKKTFHVFMVGMPDTYEDEDGAVQDNFIPAGTPFYALVKTGVESITFSGYPENEGISFGSHDPMQYNYQDGVSTKMVFSEIAPLQKITPKQVTDEGWESAENATMYTFSADGTFAKAESLPETLPANKACIFTSEPVDNIMVHYDTGTWADGGWDSVVAIVKSATVGDVNRDGKVNMVDVTNLVKYLRDNSSITIDKNAADVDNVDGNSPDKADVEALSNMILGK